MHKWKRKFCEKYQDSNTVIALNREIRDAVRKERGQRDMDKVISEVIRGKWKRRGY